MRSYTDQMTSHGRSSESDYTLGRSIGSLTAKDIEQDRRISKLEEHREKDKAEVDRLKVWAERGALLVVLYAMTAGMHASAPIVGPVIGQIARSALSGLRGP